MIRTRFAPSPTGYLHIGGARTALYNWLFAQKHGGTFVLRIEDTDLERSTPESVQAILDGMEWLNLPYEEGPFYQTMRFDRYTAVINQLLAENKAYRCYCSKERLEDLRKTQMDNKDKPRYDGHCRNIEEALDAPFVIRFKNPEHGVVEFNDAVKGPIIIANSELDDLIIARSDGTPTYNFTVVIDDWDMEITHVIRGDDHINNTPRQINILRALGANLPQYAHVPMILGSDGKRLSKRHGAVSVLQYREEGFLPEALLNYLVRLGWSYGDQEVFSREQMVELFDLTGINKAPAAFNEEKLLWLNQQYLKSADVDYVAKELLWHMEKLGIDVAQGPALSEVVKVQVDRCKTLLEIAEKSRYFYEPIHLTLDLKAQISAELIPAFTMLYEKIAELDDWNKEDINEAVKTTAEANHLKLGQFAPFLRIIMTGSKVSPSIDVTLWLIGQAEVLRRLESALKVQETGMD